MSAPSSTHEKSDKLTPMTNDPSFTPPPSNPNTRVPPHNSDAEASLLGAMLLSRDAIGPAVETLRVTNSASAHYLDAIASLYGAGEPADPVTVAEELSRSGLLEQIGGPQRLWSYRPAPASSARLVTHGLLRNMHC